MNMQVYRIEFYRNIFPNEYLMSIYTGYKDRIITISNTWFM